MVDIFPDLSCKDNFYEAPKTAWTTTQSITHIPMYSSMSNIVERCAKLDFPTWAVDNSKQCVPLPAPAVAPNYSPNVCTHTQDMVHYPWIIDLCKESTSQTEPTCVANNAVASICQWIFHEQPSNEVNTCVHAASVSNVKAEVYKCKDTTVQTLEACQET